MQKIFFRWLPVLAWMLVIFYFSSRPTLPDTSKHPISDFLIKKSGHMVEYAILMWLVLRAIAPAALNEKWKVIIAFALVLAYAASDEFHQSFVPNRTALATDVLIFDHLGAWMGFVVWRYKQLNQHHSRITFIYWLIFLYCLALAIGLNLPFKSRPAQDSSLLLNDAWFLWSFGYFGVLLMLVAALAIEDGAQRGMKWWFYIVPYFVVGILPLSVFMARRKTLAVAPAHLNARLSSALNQRWFWALMPVLVVALSLWWLPNGSLAQHINTLNHNTGFWFMWLDIPLNHMVALPLLQSDMQRRNMPNQKRWLAFALFTGAMGLGIYMAVRKPK